MGRDTERALREYINELEREREEDNEMMKSIKADFVQDWSREPTGAVIPFVVGAISGSLVVSILWLLIS